MLFKSDARDTPNSCFFNLPTVLVAEVDDLVITGTDEDKISEIKRDFTVRYKITAWEQICSFLGINMVYERTQGTFRSR